MGAVSEQARTESIRIKLAPQTSKQLEDLAVEYGMPTSTLAAFAISQWIIEQDRKLKLMKLAAVETSRKMAESFSGESLEKALVAALPAMVKAMAAEGHELDGDKIAALVDRAEAPASK